MLVDKLGFDWTKRALNETMGRPPYPRGWRGGREVFHSPMSALVDTNVQIILKYLYTGMDYRHDPEMVLTPVEVRGLLDVGPRG